MTSVAFQTILRKQIRKLPKILKSVKIIHYHSLLFIRVRGATSTPTSAPSTAQSSSCAWPPPWTRTPRREGPATREASALRGGVLKRVLRPGVLKSRLKRQLSRFRRNNQTSQINNFTIFNEFHNISAHLSKTRW